MSIRIPALFCAAFLTFTLSSAAAQEFSANVVTTNAEGDTTTAPGRVLVADGKVHLELPDFPDGHFFIDPAANAAYFVRPARRVFMEARQSSRLAQILVVVDPDTPCQQWEAVALITRLASPEHSWQCTRLGTELIDARDTVHYQAIAPDAHSYDIWVDPKIRFPVRFRAEVDAVVNITNIAENPQPRAAFEIPAGFSKFDPQGLIDRIKQSDVWVEQPRTR
jgi:hypothetical protein